MGFKNNQGLLFVPRSPSLGPQGTEGQLGRRWKWCLDLSGREAEGNVAGLLEGRGQVQETGPQLQRLRGATGGCCGGPRPDVGEPLGTVVSAAVCFQQIFFFFRTMGI